MNVVRKADGWYVVIKHGFLDRNHPPIGPFATMGHAEVTADTLEAIVRDAENEGARNYAMSEYS